MERPTVLIISDDPAFATALCKRWQSERNAPAFLLNDTETTPGSFDLAIAGTTQLAVLESLQHSAAPVIQVSRAKSNLSGVITIPEVDGWPELVIAVAKQILESRRYALELARLSESRSQLEREAALGRYILEMRHSLNNALTSILGNSELMLMDTQSISSSVRLQIEIIRNMGMRMNEILQRFSSLEKEMHFSGQHKPEKVTRGAAVGV